MCDSRRPENGADSGWYPDLHTCTQEECGRTCVWEDGVPTHSFHVSGAPDSGGFDAEGPCPCEEHVSFTGA